jgi:hypothetical protein
LHPLDSNSSSSSIAKSPFRIKMKVLAFFATNIKMHLDCRLYTMILRFYHDLRNLEFDPQKAKYMIISAWEKI